MKIMALIGVLGFGIIFAQGSEIVEERPLVCIDAQDHVYGLAMVHHREAGGERWDGMLFTQENLKDYQAGKNFYELEPLFFGSDYDGDSPEFTANLLDGSRVRMYSCKKLSVLDRFLGEAEWYKMLTDYFAR